MTNYNSSDVVQCLRQYDMFANSLRLIKNPEERNMIIKQLTKLEEKIIAITNETYLEEYTKLRDKKCGLFDDEKQRLTTLIDLINERLSYVEKRCNSHYQLTGTSMDAPEVEGANTLSELEERVRIIDKYSKNLKYIAELDDDIKSLSNKISLASEKMEINKSLNEELEVSFKRTLNEAFDKLNLYELEDIKDEIEYAYYETEKSLSLASKNYEVARNGHIEVLDECRDMLDEITSEYNEYRNKIGILKLIELANSETSDYEGLLNKRKEINEVLKYIKNEELLQMIIDIVDKQYNTITMEEQDINTYNDLVLERDRKQNNKDDLLAENNSDKFQTVLKELIENEEKRQAKIREEQLRLEELEKKKRLEIERRRQEEILRRQKIIEEARKKEIEKRTKQLLEEQQNSVLQPKKKETITSFETDKEEPNEEIIPKREEKNIETYNEPYYEEPKVEAEPKKEFQFDMNSLKNILREDRIEEEVPSYEESVPLKNKGTIEQELFDEFNKEDHDIKEKYHDEESIDNLYTSIDEKLSNNNKLPDVSIDEYMKNFSEKNIDSTMDLFDDTSFPSIPM